MGLDPLYLYDNADVIWYGTNTYSNALSALQQVTGKSDVAVEMMLNGQYGAADYWTAVQALKDNGVVMARNTNGYNCFAYASDVTMTAPSGPISQIDSSATSTTLVKGAPVYDVVVDDVVSSPTHGKVLTNPVGSLLTPEHGFYGWKFFAGECLQAIGCASAGITLGKNIDSALYNLNPDFWDAAGMSSLNPETWSSITNGDDSFAAGLFNTIFGIDPNSGNAQAFLDENAFAYLAYWMKLNGIFNPTYDMTDKSTITNQSVIDSLQAKIPSSFGVQSFIGGMWRWWNTRYGYGADTTFTVTSGSPLYTCLWGSYNANDTRRRYMLFSTSPFTITQVYQPLGSGQVPSGDPTTTTLTSESYSAAGLTYYELDFDAGSKYTYQTYPIDTLMFGNWEFTDHAAQSISGPQRWTVPAIYYNGTNSTVGIEGITNNPNSVQPNVDNWDELSDVLPSLQEQYPSMWDNAVPNTIVQPDGSTKTITYVPIAIPNANGQWDSQPTSSISDQTNPQVQPQSNPTPENNDLLKMILQLITMPEPQPDPNTQTQTQPNPDIPDMPTTGDGSSPAPVPPTGSASALWAVYHPTQAQIDSFGAWLWSTNFVDQLLKVFQNPMDAIITLHKVFVTPTDAGTTTIHAGYLDSEVSSAYVTQQYEYVDCGSVDCYEYFGTVFDYIGTNVSLYLPFIGIVPLNVDEVMRSTINVRYGCDLFTGAILVEVNITRDGNDVVMYQYGGDGGVQYPVSGSRSGGFITGLAATIGAAASVATGGALLPAAAAAVGGSVVSAQKQVQHSGGFSGNSGAMGCKTPYLIIERPQTKIADTFPRIEGYPTNYSSRLGDLSGQVNVKSVHVEGINATDAELKEIESLLKSGVLV